MAGGWRTRVALSALAAGLLLTSKARANPMDSVAQRLDSEAMREYVANNMGNAERKLKDAQIACGKGGCSVHVMAQIRRDAGILYAGGQSKPSEGKAAFLEALKLEPNLVLPKLLASAE